jgi:hypothetical protein
MCIARSFGNKWALACTLWLEYILKEAFPSEKIVLLRPYLPLLTCGVYLHKLTSSCKRWIEFFHLFFKQGSQFWKLVPESPFILHVIQLSFALWRIELPCNACITRRGLEASLCVCVCVVLSADESKVTSLQHPVFWYRQQLLGTNCDIVTYVLICKFVQIHLCVSSIQIRGRLRTLELWKLYMF